MPPMSSKKLAEEIEADVMAWASTFIPALPDYDTPEYEDMVYFDLEAIRNAGLATYQYMPEFVWDRRSAVETLTDLLTTVRYGRRPGHPLVYVRTGYVPALQHAPFQYPEHVLEDCVCGLEKLTKHREIFSTGASPVLVQKLDAFAQAVEMMISECFME